MKGSMKGRMHGYGMGMSYKKGGFPKNRHLKGFPDSAKGSGGGQSERLDEGMAQSVASDKNQNSPYSAMEKTKKPNVLDAGGPLAGV